MDKFCSLFAANECERDARIKARADEIYELINALAGTYTLSTYTARYLEFKDMARELLDYIDGKEEDDE